MLAARNLKKTLTKMEVDQTKSCQTNDGRAYLPGQNAFKIKIYMRYELSLSLFVLFQEHDTICIHYNNASAY